MSVSDGKSFEYKTKIEGETSERPPQPRNPGDADQPAQPPVPSLNIEVTISLTYLINFWRSLGFSLMNSEVELDLLWTKDCVLIKHFNNITGVNVMITIR